MTPRLFWWTLVWACVVWYSTLTFYVLFKGIRDINAMLDQLKPADSKERR